MVQAKTLHANVLKVFQEHVKTNNAMAKKIYFGDVKIMHIKTREVQTVGQKLFKEGDSLNSDMLRNSTMRHIKSKDRKNYRIIRLCYDTAKHVGETIY